MPSLARALVALLLLCLAGAADAQTLRIGSRATPAVDPHFQWLTTNEAYSRHIFDSLVRRDAESRIEPGLAESWTMLDPLTWEFRLRRGVRFHDGSEFTAEDVRFTLERVATLPNNPNPYTSNIRSIRRVEVVDSHTIRFHAEAPDPLLHAPLANIYIVSHRAARDAGPADFRSGRAAVGTGPYRFVSHTPDAELVLERNEQYWDAKPHWQRVVFRIISGDAPRVTALLAGDVDVADFLPSRDVATLERDPRVAVHKGASDRLMYVMLDVGRSPSPFVTDLEGQPLTPNPLMDPRVRRAMAMSINRDGLVSQVMDGMGVVTNQMMPPGMIGWDPDFPGVRYDVAQARALLAEAGFANGFGLSLHCSNNRYLNDARLCQAVGQMFARIGIRTRVETMPLNVFFPRITPPRSEFSAILVGWGNSSTGTAAGFLTALMHSFDPVKRRGHANRAYFSDPRYDAMVDAAVTELDADRRAALMREAVRYASDTYVSLPLLVQGTALATRRDLVAETRNDEMTLAMAVRPAAPR
jgi:peptide/nickel transport system substrate-binding protein